MTKFTTTVDDYPAPPHLSDRAAALWSAVVPARARSPERLALLCVALEAFDRADAAREAIAVEGMTTETKRSGVTHLHPLLRVEKESRALFAKIWSQMNLQFNPSLDSRR